MMETFLAGLMTFFSSSPPIASQLPLVIASLAGFTLLLAVSGIYSTLRFYRTHQTLMKRISGGRISRLTRVREERLTAWGWLLSLLKLAGAVSKPHSERDLSKTRRVLLKGGYRSADASTVFFGVKFYLAILVPTVCAALAPVVMHNLSLTFFFAVLLAVMGFYAPDIWVRLKIRRRRQQILEGFPDALDLMVVCVEAGLGLDAAIHKVGEEIQLTNRVLSTEFRFLELGLRAGQSHQLALMSLSRRIDVEEVSNFVTLLIQTEQFGTSVSQALRVHADAMRVKRWQIAEEKAIKLPVKLLFPLLFLIFPSLFVVILGPGMVRLMRVILHMSSSAPGG